MKESNAAQRTGTCRLCNETRTLQGSHVIPRFVFKWLRETGITKHIRFSEDPDGRVQDGPKEQWLCWDCEQKFGRWENTFKREMFVPTTQEKAWSSYSKESVLCALSIAWRAGLWLCSHEARLRREPVRKARSRVKNVLESWRSDLVRGELSRGTKIRAIPLGSTRNVIGEFGGYQNRYLKRHIEVDIVWRGQEDVAYVWCKLGPMAVVGIAAEGEGLRQTWKGADLKPEGDENTEGQVRVLPEGILEYMQEKASQSRRIMGGARQAKRKKAGAGKRQQRPSRKELEKTDMGRAMLADSRMFGVLPGEGEEEGVVVVRTQIKTSWRPEFRDEAVMQQCAAAFRHLVHQIVRSKGELEEERWGMLEALGEACITLLALWHTETEGRNTPQVLETTAVVRRTAKGEMRMMWWEGYTREAEQSERAALEDRIYEAEVTPNEINTATHENLEGLGRWMQEAAMRIRSLCGDLDQERHVSEAAEVEKEIEELAATSAILWSTKKWIGLGEANLDRYDKYLFYVKTDQNRKRLLKEDVWRNSNMTGAVGTPSETSA